MEYKPPAEPEGLTRPLSLGRQLNFAAGACMTMCNAMLEQFGLTLPQWVVLSALWRQDHLTIGEIAAYSGNNVPATSRILDRMIEKNLLQRQTDRMDKRAVRVGLCAAGENLRHLQDFQQTVNASLLAGLSRQEADQLSALLDHVEQNARSWLRLDVGGPAERGEKAFQPSQAIRWQGQG